jgi:polysaccharide chain length determinant protein (PEP-CTERM system associated)
MKELLQTVLDQVRGVWRFRSQAILAAWIAAIVLILVVLVWPNSYRATARVYVDTSTALRPLLSGLAVEQDIEARMNIVREQMLGNDKLERVSLAANLYHPEADAKIKNNVHDSLRNSVIIDTTLPTSARRDRAPTADRIFTITYENSDRQKALIVVDTLLKALVSDTQGSTSEGSEDARAFLRQQISDYEKRLSESEGKLADFKKENVGLVPGQSQSDFFSRLQAEITASKRAETALQLATRRRAELQRQLRSEQPFSAAAVSMGAQPRNGNGSGGVDTASRIAETQARLDELLMRFTEKHPEVLAAREQLDSLKDRQKGELEAFRRGDPGAIANSGLSANPVYQSIQLQMNQTEVEIATLSGELDDHRRAEADLRRLLNTAPAVEAEFARLARDYDVNKAQYTALLERLEKAKISDDASQTGLAKFDIIEPPNAGSKPASPNRPLLLFVALFFSGAVGIAVAWLLSQLKPVFASAGNLAELTGLPVFGVVTKALLPAHAAEARAGNLRFAGAVGGLLVVFVTVVVTHRASASFLHDLFTI